MFVDIFAAGGADAEDLAEALSIAFCIAGDSGRAFAEVCQVSLRRNRRGCVVLERARTLAVTRCRGGLFRTYSETTVVGEVLGGCGLRRDWSGFGVTGRRSQLL